jgi:hypothetical protein
MVARGFVQNGVVVLEGGVRLPEGQQVMVLIPPATASPSHSVLNILPVSLGLVTVPLAKDDDLPGEMLEGRS